MNGGWYTEEELLDVLADDIVVTPAFCRISRMIRDFSSDDIMVGNKKHNLRQLVENRLAARGDGATVREIRYREISTAGADPPSGLGGRHRGVRNGGADRVLLRVGYSDCRE